MSDTPDANEVLLSQVAEIRDAVIGTPDKPGVMERTRTLETTVAVWQSTLNTTRKWFIIGVLAVSSNVVLDLIKSYLTHTQPITQAAPQVAPPADH